MISNMGRKATVRYCSRISRKELMRQGHIYANSIFVCIEPSGARLRIDAASGVVYIQTPAGDGKYHESMLGQLLSFEQGW
jgi:hypothetical protein